MPMIKELKLIGSALISGFSLLKRKDPMLLCSSTAFFATFALSPIITILIQVFSFYFQSDRINHQLFLAIGATVGPQTAQDIEKIVANFKSLESNWAVTIFGTIFFLFVATTLLGIVKKAIQQIWQIRPKPGIHLRYQSKERAVQLAFIVLTGTLILISLFIDVRLKISRDYMQAFWPEAAVTIVYFFNTVFAIIVVVFWFTILFKFIPEASISWDTAFTGGLLTGVMFSIGKYILQNLLVHSRMSTIFGASASIAIILLFIFYSAFILYFGAAFTYQYAQLAESPVCPTRHADEYEERIITREDVQPSGLE